MTTDYIFIGLLAVALVITGILAEWQWLRQERTIKRQKTVISDEMRANRALRSDNSQLIKDVKDLQNMTPEQIQARYYPPYITPTRPLANTTRAQVVDELLTKENDALARAQGAMWRLNQTMLKALASKPDGSGPIFSADKIKVSSRAIATSMTDLDGDDYMTVSQWLKDHPGQVDKLLVEG